VRRLALALMLLAAACARELPDGAAKTVVERSKKGARVIFVGLDGADFRLLEPFVADGTMPELAKILQRSETRVLRTQHPPLSPLVWTSMMTGVSPLEHRILDFTRFSPATRMQEPITSDERAVPAIWNMARAGGKRVAVFGLWATYPPEPGTAMTDRDVPRDYVAATNLIHERAMKTIREQQPDLAIVYFQGTDEIGHFTSGNIAESRDYFHRIDAILGDYKKLADDLDAELIIASDHGFDWGGAHAESSTATATAAKWHREEGVWIRYPHAPARLAEARVDQVCATLLQILGLPDGEGIAAGMNDGIGASVNYRRLYTRPRAASTQANDEQLAKLKALGYISNTAPAPANATSTRTPQSFNNEGLLLREAQRIDEAEKAFREALRIDARYASARRNLDDLLSVRGVKRLKAHDCQGALADFRDIAQETALGWTAIAAAEGCLGHEREAAEAVAKAKALGATIE
jgi:hypothetical protein